MNLDSYQLIDVNVPWVFIPLSRNEALGIHLWIKRLCPSPETDKALASACEKAIETAFGKLRLKYNIEAFGAVKMDNLRLYSGTDGIAMPETCFVDVPLDVKRIKNPLRSLQDE